MTACELQDVLRELVCELIAARDDTDAALADLAGELEAVDIRDVRTYDDAGILTTDMGLVVECDNGAEFQVTIIGGR